MDCFPDAEVERHLQPRLLFVVRLRNLDFDREALGMRLDAADVGDAVRTTKKTDELAGQGRIAQSDEHLSPTFCDERPTHKSGPSVRSPG